MIENNFTQKIYKFEKKVASRQSFGEELVKLGSENSKIVALDADLSKSTQTQHFAKEFPNRFFNMGIAEANMIGCAAGLSRAGFIPFAASFGCFLTGRFDQIRMSVSFSNANVRLIGTHAGVGIGEDGHSQMALEDLALMRSLPNMTVFQPSDDQETRNFMNWSVKHQGPCYMRLTRQGLPHYQKELMSFTEGQWNLLHKAKKTKTIFLASASVLESVVDAVSLLDEKTQDSISILNASWIQKCSEENFKLIESLNAERVITVEDHYIQGGLGGLVAEKMSSLKNTSLLHRWGVEDFGQSGSPSDNYKAYKLDAEGIQERLQQI